MEPSETGCAKAAVTKIAAMTHKLQIDLTRGIIGTVGSREDLVSSRRKFHQTSISADASVSSYFLGL